MTTTRAPRRTPAASLVLLSALALSACGSDGDTASAGSAAPSTAPATRPGAPAADLAGACPATVVVQLQWQPQTDMGGIIGLLGPGYRVDGKTGAATGPLVAGGHDTGVDLELRPGGPAVGFEPVVSQMHSDDAISLGIVHGDQIVTAALAGKPVVGLTPLLRYSPSILMWDPKTHPEWKGIADIKGSGAKVVASQDQAFPTWLVSKGLLDEGQLDTSYEGTPARFVSDPSIAQQGFASSEPYVYDNEVPAWDKPVAYQLLKDVGYDIYASNITVRKDRLEALAPCLTKLVPLIQQATADFAAAPEAVNKTVIDWVGKRDAFFPYSAGEAEYAAKTLADKGLVGAEADGSIGTYDLERAQRTVDELTPVLADGGSASLSGQELYTNRFVDKRIGR